MKYIGLMLMLIGAGIAYPAKKIAAVVKKEEPTDADVLKIKAAGFVILIIGVVLVLLNS